MQTKPVLLTETGFILPKAACSLLHCQSAAASKVGLRLSRTVVSADVRRRASTMRRIASRAHLGVWALHRNQRHFWYFWCQKYIHNKNIR